MNRIDLIKVVPVCVIDNAESAPALAESLLKGGIPIIEITLRTPAAIEALAKIRKEFPDMLVGAGTVTNVEQVDAVCDAGAMFGVAPGLNENVVRRSQVKGLPFMPGVMTPSDIEKAVELGCTSLKFFPAEAAGGIKMLKAVSAPYQSLGMTFVPLGGVNVSNMSDYLALPTVNAIGGTWIAERALVAEKKWSKITQQAQEAVRIAQESQAA